MEATIDDLATGTVLTADVPVLQVLLKRSKEKDNSSKV